MRLPPVGEVDDNFERLSENLAEEFSRGISRRARTRAAGCEVLPRPRGIVQALNMMSAQQQQTPPLALAHSCSRVPRVNYNNNMEETCRPAVQRHNTIRRVPRVNNNNREEM